MILLDVEAVPFLIFQERTNMRWTVAWTYNGKDCFVNYDSYVLALAKVQQLRIYGIQATLHEKEA